MLGMMVSHSVSSTVCVQLTRSCGVSNQLLDLVNEINHDGPPTRIAAEQYVGIFRILLLPVRVPPKPLH